MGLAGTLAIFHLSSEGERALSVWVGEHSSFTALMVSSDAIGAWIVAPVAGQHSGAAEPVMLVKWDYVVTVTFEMSPEEAPGRSSIGFRPPR